MGRTMSAAVGKSRVARLAMGICSLASALAIAASLSGCGGGGRFTVTNDELPGIGNPGGGNSTVYTPAVTRPAVETYSDHSASGDSQTLRWLASSYQTLPAGSSPFQNDSLKLWSEQIFSAINANRAEAGLPALIREPHLERTAQAHARDMALRDYFAHNTPDGLSPWDRLAAVHAPAYNHAGENISAGQESVSEVIGGWMTSPGHRDVIMNPDLTYLGVGVYFDAADKTNPIHVVADFVQFTVDPSARGLWQ